MNEQKKSNEQLEWAALLELKVQCNSHIEYGVMAANHINSLN